jgi:hypothetical protein
MNNQTRKNPTGVGRYIGQFVGYGLFALLLGYFSASPDWTYFPADKALVKLSFSHLGLRKQACRDRTARELQNIPDSAKVPLSCPRERHPVHVRLWLNDDEAFSGSASPSGLSKDGPSHFYETFRVPPGKHRLKLEVMDSGPDKAGFSHQAWVDLKGRDILAIDMDRSALVLKLPTP